MVQFFIINNLRNRKLIWIVVLAFIPVIFGLLLYIIRFTLKPDISLTSILSQVSIGLFLRFLLPLISLFVGVSIVYDEVETQTLPYLLVRPIARWKLIFTKTLAQIVTVVIVLFISFLLTHILFIIDEGFRNGLHLFEKFFTSFCILIMGVLVYVPIFGIFGGLFKRPMLVGILFSFGWENLVSGFPGNVKYFTVLYYLNELYPLVNNHVATTILLSEQTSSPMALILVLIGMCLFFNFLLLSLLYFKEYSLQ